MAAGEAVLDHHGLGFLGFGLGGFAFGLGLGPVGPVEGDAEDVQGGLTLAGDKLVRIEADLAGRDESIGSPAMRESTLI